MIRIGEIVNKEAGIYFEPKDKKGTIRIKPAGSILSVSVGCEGEPAEREIMHLTAAGVMALKKEERYHFELDAGGLISFYGTDILSQVFQGIQLAFYELETYKKEEPISWEAGVTGIGEEALKQAKALLTESTYLTEGISFARNLVNAPANILTPDAMACRVEEFFQGTGVEVLILKEDEIRDLGMEAFLTVGLSGSHMPRLIVLRYQGSPEDEDITAFVGKGVTCDTGGYCLKPASSLPGVKGDNGGAAAVCGALYSVARNRLKKNVTVIIPACENRISRESFIPGDVIYSMAGKSIEIGNTDAEGRLILADAVTYAIQKEKAARIVDIATLTGAVVAMFGFTVAGALASDNDFYQEFEAASRQSGEQYYRLPILEEYKDMIKSDLADIKNTSKDGCGTITAGLFIEAFTEGLPWIHLDIAGTAWVDSPRYAYQSKGATGAGASTLYYLMKQ